VFVARGRSARLVLVRHDLRADLATKVGDATARVPAWNGGATPASMVEALAGALEDDGLAGVATAGMATAGPAFRFGERVHLSARGLDLRRIDHGLDALLLPHFPYTRSVLVLRGPVVGIVEDGAVVSACCSARRGATACEAGVDTIEGYRGRGYAPIVVAAWRDAVEREGLAPLYSTSWENGASLAVARKLRLVAYAETLSIA
jgi:hypothetical protein